MIPNDESAVRSSPHAFRSGVRLAAARHPGLPVYLMGDSMGCAVALRALADPDAPQVAGAILVAPAVWGGKAMNPAFRFGIWFAAHTTPWNYATGRGLRRVPSDNVEMLRKLGRDPLVIKATRIDTVDGLTSLMDAALAAAPRLSASSPRAPSASASHTVRASPSGSTRLRAGEPVSPAVGALGDPMSVPSQVSMGPGGEMSTPVTPTVIRTITIRP